MAASLVTTPRVLFLDEPTTGLDPRSRVGLWETVQEIVAQSAVVLLTTQYLEEEDQLADRIAVIDYGQVSGQGTLSELKATAGATELVLTIAGDSDLDSAAGLLGRADFANGPVQSTTRNKRCRGLVSPSTISSGGQRYARCEERLPGFPLGDPDQACPVVRQVRRLYSRAGR